MVWQIHRHGRWKAMFRRSNGRALLFDLETDPAESVDVSAAHPERIRAIRQRVEVLTRSLASRREDKRQSMSAEDRRRLDALGYVESLEEAESR